jgi:hypothetical protein
MNGWMNGCMDGLVHVVSRPIGGQMPGTTPHTHTPYRRTHTAHARTVPSRGLLTTPPNNSARKSSGCGAPPPSPPLLVPRARRPPNPRGRRRRLLLRLLLLLLLLLLPLLSGFRRRAADRSRSSRPAAPPPTALYTCMDRSIDRSIHCTRCGSLLANKQFSINQSHNQTVQPPPPTRVRTWLKRRKGGRGAASRSFLLPPAVPPAVWIDRSNWCVGARA